MASGASTFSVWGKVGEEHLQCPSCQDYYRQPKILSCQHSVCEACLERDQMSAVSKVECPVCWQATVLPPDGGVSALRTNFKLVDMVEAALKQHQRERGSVPVCRAHSWKESLLFCETCRELICEACAAETNGGHEHSAVEAVASKAQQVAEKSVTGIRAVMKALDDKLKMIDDVGRSLKTAAEDSRQELDERANEKIVRVKVAKQRTKEEINSKEKDRAKVLEDCRRECTVLKESMKSAVDGYRAALDSGNYASDYDFVSLYPKIGGLAEMGGRSGPDVDQTLSVLKFERFEFGDDIRLGKLVDK